MDKYINQLFKEIEIVKLAIILSENPALLEQVRALTNESTN